MPDSAFCGYDGSTNEQSAMCPGYTGSPLSCQISTDQNKISEFNKHINNFVKEGRYLVGVQSLNLACNVDHVPSLYTKLQELREFIDYTITNN